MLDAMSDAARVPAIRAALTFEQIWLLQLLAGCAGQWAFVPDEYLALAGELIALEVVRVLTLPDKQLIYHVTPLGMQVVALLVATEGPVRDA